MRIRAATEEYTVGTDLDVAADYASPRDRESPTHPRDAPKV